MLHDLHVCLLVCLCAFLLEFSITVILTDVKKNPFSYRKELSLNLGALILISDMQHTLFSFLIFLKKKICLQVFRESSEVIFKFYIVEIFWQYIASLFYSSPPTCLLCILLPTLLVFICLSNFLLSASSRRSQQFSLIYWFCQTSISTIQ